MRRRGYLGVLLLVLGCSAGTGGRDAPSAAADTDTRARDEIDASGPDTPRDGTGRDAAADRVDGSPDQPLPADADVDADYGPDLPDGDRPVDADAETAVDGLPDGSPDSRDGSDARDVDRPEDLPADGGDDGTADTEQTADIPCIPDCTDRQCGGDGCGGICGDCPGPLDVCLAGSCVCVPDCGGLWCGGDGCGGMCGDCAADQMCCAGTCHSTADCDCQCTCFGCDIHTTCTGDACTSCEAVCDDSCQAPGCGGLLHAEGECLGGQCGPCEPACAGKACGNDGCGGTCGECAPQTDCIEGACVATDCSTVADGTACQRFGPCAGRGQCAGDACVDASGAMLVVQPEPVDFGRVRWGEAATVEVRLCNVGPVPTNVAAVLGGDPGGHFALLQAFEPGWLHPGEAAHATVRCVPADLGPIAAELVVTASAWPADERRVALSATGCCEARIVYDAAEAPVEQLWLGGRFSDWTPADRFVRQAEHQWQARVALPPGDHAYLLYDGTTWFVDPDQPYYDWADGLRRSRLRVPDCRRPRLVLAAPAVVDEGGLAFEVTFVPGVTGDLLDPASVEVTRDGTPVSPDVDEAGLRIAVHETGLADTKVHYLVRAADVAQRQAASLFVPLWTMAAPPSWRAGVVYRLLTDRFADGDPANDDPVGTLDPRVDWHGGDFAGVLQALENGYFEGLGVHVLWLSSVSQNATGSENVLFGAPVPTSAYRSDWPVSTGWTDAAALPGVVPIEPHFGTPADLHALVAAAHRRGIRVIVDLEANHVHVDHPWWVQHAATSPPWFHDPDDPYICGWERPETCWLTEYQPDLDHRRRDVLEGLLDHAVWLARTFGIDGFHVRHAKHVARDLRVGLRARLADEVDTTGLHVLLLGDTFAGPAETEAVASLLGADELSGQTDYPAYWGFVQGLLRRETSLADVRAAWQFTRASYLDAYPDGVVGRFVGSPDVARPLSHAAGQIDSVWGDPLADAGWLHPASTPVEAAAYRQLRFAYTLLHCLDGVPVLYYGDERGLAGRGSPDNHRPLDFAGELNVHQQATLAYMRRLGSLRRLHPALHRGDHQDLVTDMDLWSFAKRDETETVVCVFNGRDAARSVLVPAPVAWPEGTPVVDALSDTSHSVTAGAVEVDLPGWTAAVLVSLSPPPAAR